MNTWLAAVKNSGTVAARYTGARRGTFGICLIFDVGDAVQSPQALAQRMASAAHHNATIIHDSSDGLAQEALLTRRPDAQAGTRE